MKATIERATLLRCLSHVQSVVERRNTIPILSNVLIEKQGDQLMLLATDIEIQIRTTPAGNIGATSSVRLRVSFSSMRCSAIARVIGLPSSAR